MLIIAAFVCRFYLYYVLLFTAFFFFFNDTATTEIYTLSLHDALPIYAFLQITRRRFLNEWEAFKKVISRRNIRRLPIHSRSEERFSRNAETDLVCRLLLEKKKNQTQSLSATFRCG